MILEKFSITFMAKAGGNIPRDREFHVYPVLRLFH